MYLTKELDLMREKRIGGWQRERLKREIDGLIAAECPLTGDVVIEKTSKILPGAEVDDNDSSVRLTVPDDI